MRLRWIDLLRSAALFGMIVYHAAYDLQFLHDWNLDVLHGPWKIFQVAVASLFLIVSGISAGFWTHSPDALRKGWNRGWRILSAAMLVSLVTAIAFPDMWVRFGILHLIALAAFLLPFLRRLHPAVIALLGVACLALTPLDLMPQIASVDYTPPVPWLALILFGFAAGVPLAKRGQISYARPRMATLGNVFAWPGRHSLAIYLVHQPVIIAALWLVLG